MTKEAYAEAPIPMLTPTPTPMPPATPVSPLLGSPIRLTIPMLHIDAVIRPMGIGADGRMEVPEVAADAGWYKFGSRPGDPGTAVIAGHVDGENGEHGVFADLGMLKQGDAIGVTDEYGNIGTFIVRESKEYDVSVDTSKIFASRDGTHLNLITCVGAWDQTKRTYNKRLVVFADLMK